MTSYTFRLDEELKQQAFSVFRNYGLNPAQAIKMILRQVAETKTIPVELNYQPNAETAEAIRELMAGEAESYQVNNLDEFQKLTQKLIAE